MNIEEHYHIQELINAQEKRSNDREFHHNRIKANEEREELVKDSKRITVTDFYCLLCKQDFKSVSIRQIESDWSNTKQRIAFYKTKCDKGHWCIRHITDKLTDSFWTKSKLMAKDRANHMNDILQPFQTGYNLMFGKK